MSSDLERELSIPPAAFLPQESEFKVFLSTGGVKIQIDPTTSINSSKKCLLVGRQANSADIRIDHKSISRKHAVIYFMRNDESQNVQMMLKDLGGKYGCKVNGDRVSMKALSNGDQIQFGNVREQSFKVELPSQEEMNEAMIVKTEAHRDDNVDSQEEKTHLTGRAAREAEIAAMMASLDEKPTYTKYSAQDEEENELVSTNESSGGNKSSIVYQFKIPITSHITIPVPNASSSASLLTSVCIDPSGSRLLIGSSDNTLRLYDFSGMDMTAQPFKIITVQDGHSIVKAVYSNTGDKILVGTTSAQPMLLDRDGNQIIEFNKGDMYVTDMTKTDGHIAQITAVDWHPLDRNLCITSSLDGSVRIWNVEKNKTKFEKLCSGKEVYRIKCAMGKRTMVTALAFAPGGREFACGTSCGSIQIWSTLKVGSRPERVVYDAHGSGNAIHSLIYNVDGTKLASRSKDDAFVHIWQSRQISRSSKPFLACEGSKGFHESVTSCFSPDGRLLIVGTCVEPKSNFRSCLKIYQIDGDTSLRPLSPIHEMNVGDKGVSIVNVIWHRILNQIVVALSNGTLQMFYDDNWSKRGATTLVAKGVQKTDDLAQLLSKRAKDTGAFVGEILTPNALPIFRQETQTGTKRKREKDRKDPIKSKRPDLPGTGIKVSEGTSAGLNFQQTVLTSSIGKNKNIAGKDPRTELFKFSEGKSYGLGDKTILAEKTVEEEEEEMKRTD
jgi:WD repeat-containing protein 70